LDVPTPPDVSTSSVVITRRAGPGGTFIFGTPEAAGPDGTSFLSIPPPSVTPTTTTPSTTTPTTTTPSTTTPSSNILNLRVKTGDVTHAQDFDLSTGTRGSPTTTGTGTTTSSPFVQFNGIQNPTETIEIYRPGNSTDLNFSSFGAWDTNTIAPNVTGGFGVIASGQNTPVGAMPTSGTATYTGGTTGFLQTSATSAETRIRGTATVTANFGTAAITSAFNIPGQFNFIGTGSIVGGTNTYTGSTTTTSVANSALPAAMLGDLRGAFYGPAAQETAGTWTLKGGQAQAIGAFGAKR